MMDIFQKGNFIFCESGFGLVTNKSVNWYDASGNLLGEITAEHPIHCIYSAQDELVVETRQHRATINGAPSWWLHKQNEAAGPNSDIITHYF